MPENIHRKLITSRKHNKHALQQYRNRKRGNGSRDDIEYTLNIIYADGCKNEDVIFIKVVKDFIVPNTFSPNGDGINDLWKIENLIYYPNHRLEIFNRNGQKLFESTNYNGEWDGTLKGKSLPSGTYYYIIDLDGARAPKKGYVTIIR